jgi:hypothetical protein
VRRGISADETGGRDNVGKIFWSLKVSRPATLGGDRTCFKLWIAPQIMGKAEVLEDADVRFVIDRMA